MIQDNGLATNYNILNDSDYLLEVNKKLDNLFY